MFIAISWTEIVDYFFQYVANPVINGNSMVMEHLTVPGYIIACITVVGFALKYSLGRRSVKAQEKRANIDQQLLEATTTAHTKIAESSEKISDALVQTIQQGSKGEEKVEQHQTEVNQGNNSNNFDLKNMQIGGTGNNISITLNQPAPTTGSRSSSTAGSSEVINPDQEQALAIAIEDNLEKNDFKRFLQKIGVKPQRINDPGRLADYAGNAIKKVKGKTYGKGNLQELLEAMAYDEEDAQEFAMKWLEILFPSKC